MSFAVRSRYLRLLIPAVLILLFLAALCWVLGGSGCLYRFRTPQTADTLRLEDLEGAYVSAPADTLAAQTFAFLGYSVDEEEDPIIEERFCYLIVEGKYLTVRVTKADVDELSKYENGEEMVSSGAIGSLKELHFADLSGVVVQEEDREARSMLEHWITTQLIQTDKDGVTTDSATGADVSAMAETGDYSEYLREVILPMKMTVGYWGSHSPAAANTLAVLAIGKGAEHIELTPIAEGESHAYYRRDGIHYVPKVRLADLLI